MTKQETKEEVKKINREAKDQTKDAKAINEAGERIEKKLARMHAAAREDLKAYAEENGIALDGSAKAGTALVKEAMHYYSQGRAGLEFNANTPAGQGEHAEFAQNMHAHGQEARAQEQMEALAEEEPQAQTAQAIAEEPALQAEEENTEEAPTLEEVAGESEAEPAETLSEPEQSTQEQAEAEPTPEEDAALEAQAKTKQKMDEALEGMTKKGRTLVMKWAANEHVSLRMEDGSESGLAFAQFAKKWYTAGREGTSVTQVAFTETDTEFPAFLQTEFYNQGRADALAAENRSAEEIADILNPAENQKGTENLETEAEEETKAKYSLRPDVPLTEEEIEKNREEAVEMEPVIHLRGDEFKLGTGKLKEEVLNHYKNEYGGSVDVPIIGDVALDRKGLEKSLGHGMTKEKAAAYAAVPSVLTNGRIIRYEKN